MRDFLHKIIKEKKRDEIDKINAVTIVNKIFQDLQERERDVLSRRFSLFGHDQQTLEEIGKLHNLTRERVRQIEKTSLDKLKNLNNLESELKTIRDVVEVILDEHGGMMERDFLLDLLSVLTLQANYKNNKDNSIKGTYSHKNYFDFILSNLLNEHIERVDKSDKFESFYKIRDRAINHLEDLVQDLREHIINIKQTVKFEDLIDKIKDLKTFKINESKILQNTGLDLSDIFQDDIFPEDGENINKNKALYSLLQAIKDINRNKFGHWGHNSWPEIKPKRIADKIFLILKNEGQPMHFNDITEKLNTAGFDNKKANSGSVHNELILDDRYVLFDRGIYGLKDWRS